MEEILLQDQNQIKSLSSKGLLQMSKDKSQRVLAREEADKKRPIIARAQGQKAHPVFTLGIPSWMTREITGEFEGERYVAKMRKYHFKAELTEEGILFRAYKVSRKEKAGW